MLLQKRPTFSRESSFELIWTNILESNDIYNIEIFPRKSDGTDGCWRWGYDTTGQKLKHLVGLPVNNNVGYDIFEKDYLETDGEIRRLKPKSVMMGSNYSTDGATKSFKTLFDDAVFNNPKSIHFLSDLIAYSTSTFDKNIVLDFFSGSSSTAHAVMKLNAEDGGNRKFIMVQIPEETDILSEAHKAGYKNICEIGKERIRRAGKKIKVENKDKNGIENLDIGFRVFKIDSLNMKEVNIHPNEITQKNLFETEKNIKEDRTPEDLLIQVILNSGLTLDLSIESKQILGNKVYFVAGNSLVACFDDDVNFGIVEELAKIEPLKVVFRDSSFKNDSDRINFETKFKKLSPESDLRVI